MFLFLFTKKLWPEFVTYAALGVSLWKIGLKPDPVFSSHLFPPHGGDAAWGSGWEKKTIHFFSNSCHIFRYFVQFRLTSQLRLRGASLKPVTPGQVAGVRASLCHFMMARARGSGTTCPIQTRPKQKNTKFFSCAADSGAKLRHFSMRVAVGSMRAGSLLAGGAQVCGSAGVGTDQTGEPARWTEGKSNSIIPRVSSASLGAHQRDHVRSLTGAPPMDVITVLRNNAWDVKTNRLIDNLIPNLILAPRWIIEPQSLRGDGMKKKKKGILSQIKCRRRRLSPTSWRRMWISSHTQRFLDEIPTSNPDPSSLTNIPAQQQK